MMPEEQKAAEEELIRFQEENPDYWGDQDENGVDLAHLRENLKLTPAERIARLESGRFWFEMMKIPAPRTPFAEIIRFFHQTKVRFVLVDGVALAAHGSNYLITDIAFAYATDTENITNLVNLLQTLHAQALGQMACGGVATLRETLQKSRFLKLHTDFGEINLVREIPEIESFAALVERAVPMDLGGFIVRVASIDDLISMKRAANRPKDQLHLYELLALKKLTDEAS